MLNEAEPEADMPGFHQEGESDDDKRMGCYAPTDPSESHCSSSDSEEEAADECPPKRGTTEAESPSKRTRMSARALRDSSRRYALGVPPVQQQPKPEPGRCSAEAELRSRFGSTRVKQILEELDELPEFQMIEPKG